jgi:hypothetical protein
LIAFLKQKTQGHGRKVYNDLKYLEILHTQLKSAWIAWILRDNPIVMLWTIADLTT